MTDYLGYLTWWTVPDVMAPYKELKDAATRVGFPLDCVPKPPAPRHAWEKAANVGGQRGLLLETPTDLGNSVFIRHGVAPEVRLITRRVSCAVPASRARGDGRDPGPRRRATLDAHRGRAGV